MSHHSKLLAEASEIKIKSKPLAYYINKLKKKKPFKFARYGDGEWTAILSPDPNKGNCDGHNYSYELSADLAKTVIEPSDAIEYGLQPLAAATMGAPIKAYLGKTPIKWTNADVFHAASEGRTLYEFADALRKREPIVVGARQWNNGGFLKPGAFLQVPSKGVYGAKGEVLELLQKIPLDGKVVLLACSMLSEVILYALKDAETTTVIDVGSVFDPWLGVYNRGYHDNLGELDERVYGK